MRLKDELTRDAAGNVTAVKIDGKEYEEVPDHIFKELSGSFAMAYGVKVRGGKGWVPKGRVPGMQKDLDSIEQELMNINLQGTRKTGGMQFAEIERRAFAKVEKEKLI